MTGYVRLNKIKILFNRVEADGFSEGKIEINIRLPPVSRDLHLNVCRYHI